MTISIMYFCLVASHCPCTHQNLNCIILYIYTLVQPLNYICVLNILSYLVTSQLSSHNVSQFSSTFVHCIGLCFTLLQISLEFTSGLSHYIVHYTSMVISITTYCTATLHKNCQFSYFPLNTHFNHFNIIFLWLFG